MEFVRRPILAVLIAAILLFSSGCAGTSAFGGSRASTVDWALKRGFAVDETVGGSFQLLLLSRVGQAANNTLTIYFEGDGAPWASPWHPPRDPTPVKPVALALAAADPSPGVVYLGRPCQYLDAAALPVCDSAWWVERRFAPEVVDAYEEILSVLKSSHGASHLRLIGYSGGGVIAALLALRRTDIEQLITVAAPLALSEWVAWHDMAPLVGSLDPVRQPGSLPPTTIHWVGGQDKTVPLAIAEAFIKQKGGRIRVETAYSHECCWDRNWPGLLEEI